MLKKNGEILYFMESVCFVLIGWVDLMGDKKKYFRIVKLFMMFYWINIKYFIDL